MHTSKFPWRTAAKLFSFGLALALCVPTAAEIGREHSSYERLEDGEEHTISLKELLRRGEAAFNAQWTAVEGAGRPFATGTGGPLADSGDPLHFPRNFNRISARDANSCAGCHNAPFGLSGGGGDFVTGVFVAAQRFDFATFDQSDRMPTKGAVDESSNPVKLQTIGNFRATIGMFGSGFIEMLARQMTRELQLIRDSVRPGENLPLETKGVSFGSIGRDDSGNWDVAAIEGLPPQSLLTSAPSDPPSLIIHPFHQSGSVVSIRQFTNNAYNHHHGMQSVERFGDNIDNDGDGVVNELTRADITAATVFQATLPVPGQVWPDEHEARRAARHGKRLFDEIGCADCHIPALPLVDQGWIYTEPNPFNPPGNLQAAEHETLSVDLTLGSLPGKRLKPRNGAVWVPAFTDLKLHDITTGPGDSNEEAININAPSGSTEFLAGNRRFLTKKLWGAANERPYFHHGQFTTLREATLAHAGEALASRHSFEGLSDDEQDEVIEFLKTLQVVAPRN
jgi:cytochrome c peroxidase